MSRLKVAIINGNEPNFDNDAFKYFILYVNRIQLTYEFFFPDLNYYTFDNGNDDIVFESSLEKLEDFISSFHIDADNYICVVTKSFDNNYFFNCSGNKAIITTDIWDKHFSPPSLFEYLLHCIYSCLIYSQTVPDNVELSDEQLIMTIGSHPETKGCIADFTRVKNDDRIDIMLGYICEDHTQKIETYYGDEYLKEVQFVIDRKWIGDIETKDSVAYNLKHIFKFDINKDSGFNKSGFEKFEEKLYEIPGEIILEVLKLIVGAVLAYYFIKWGLTKD